MKMPTYILTLVLPLLASLPTTTSQDSQTFWADYPACEEQCHESVWASQQCSLSNNCGCNSCLCLADSCLCETNSWLIAVAQCIGTSCGAQDVTTAASIVNSACSGKGFHLAVPSTALISYGMVAIATTTSTRSTTSSTSSPNPTSSTGSSLLPPGVLAGIVIPSVIGGLGLISGFIYWCWKPEEFKELLKKCCCCGSKRRGKGTNNRRTDSNGILLSARDMRGTDPTS